MQTLILKAGDPMTKQTEDRVNKKGDSPRVNNSAREATNVFRYIARSVCHIILKMRLKEMGVGI